MVTGEGHTDLVPPLLVALRQRGSQAHNEPVMTQMVWDSLERAVDWGQTVRRSSDDEEVNQESRRGAGGRRGERGIGFGTYRLYNNSVLQVELRDGGLGLSLTAPFRIVGLFVSGSEIAGFWPILQVAQRSQSHSTLTLDPLVRREARIRSKASSQIQKKRKTVRVVLVPLWSASSPPFSTGT
jgi:hypothetical protein